VKPHETGMDYSYQMRMHTASQVVLMLDKLQEKNKALVCAGDPTKLVCSFPLFDCCSQYFRIILGKYTFQYKAVRLSGSQVSEAAFPRKNAPDTLNTSFSKMAAGHGLIQIWWEKLPNQEGDGDLSLTV
jgi:hypothetical protein